ncbi:MAG: GH109 [uncultured Thermomicrobiales bacterium]|uniref:GH109 n=1 Tax=uncultured Thermomicrobiales bacterium TaxID=1645740 RepID=A0A6J4UPN9_9BACT|nr:MAG: GH109 [uncultured Thermomicrobiales bacterium]
MVGPIAGRPVRVAVLGAGTWANFAHLPGWARDPRCELVAVCDVDEALAKKAAADFGIPSVATDYRAVIERADVDVVDVCTPSATHFDLATAALGAGKHVLCEKPVAFDFRETARAAELARSRGLKTKLGFTFRYAPAMRYMRELVDQGFCGEPYIYNAYEQNSQWIDPKTPLRQVDVNADQSQIQVSSLEGYGAPVIDIARWMVGADLASVVGTLRNFVPERMVRATGTTMRMNIDDGDIFIGEFANGVIGSIQTSYVTVGNYPGIEVRLYGSAGAIIVRLVEEFGVAETIKTARPDDVEFKQQEVPARFYPAGGSARESWRTLFYANLIKDFLDELTTETDKNEGNFDDGAWVQEVINAVEISFRERRWTELPLPR